MSLLDVLRIGVKVVDGVTKPLQSTVLYSRFVSSDAYGAPVYNPVNVSMKAIVDWKQTQVRTMSGVMAQSRATVMFLDIAALVVATSGDGISHLDRIILPDGSTGPILNMTGFIDPGTTHPIETEVYLG